LAYPNYLLIFLRVEYLRRKFYRICYTCTLKRIKNMINKLINDFFDRVLLALDKI